jgi:hypothetical protein
MNAHGARRLLSSVLPAQRDSEVVINHNQRHRLESDHLLRTVVKGKLYSPNCNPL